MSGELPGACCRAILSEGLDLCVRARKLDAQDRTNAMVEFMPGIDLERAAPRLNASNPDTPYLTKSHTIALWVAEQYGTRPCRLGETRPEAPFAGLPSPSPRRRVT